MKKLLVCLTIIGALTVSCGSEGGEATESKLEVITPSALAAKFEKAETFDVAVKGEIAGVCQMMGCWISFDANGNEVTVLLKDGLSAPKDCAGKIATVEGKAQVSEVSVADLKHYAMDAGKDSATIAAITAPEMKWEIVASKLTIE